MIKHLRSHSPNIEVYNPMPPPFYNTGMQSAGMLRYNINMNNIEVYDGMGWHILSQESGIGLMPDAESAINWAREKMREEIALKAKMEQYPTLKAAYEQFKMLEILVHEEEKQNA